MVECRPAKVIAVHPEHHTVDVQFLDNGGYYQGALVLAPWAGTNFGEARLVGPTQQNPDDPPLLTGERDMLAMVLFVRGAAYVLGFIYPQVSQMLFAEQDRQITRHPSDVYTSVDAQGNIELYHPSGTFIRIGESLAHDDLTGKDFDGKWKIEANTERAPGVAVTVANGGEVKSTVAMDQDGNVTVTGTGMLSADFEGAATIKSATHVTIDAPDCQMTGNLAVNGNIGAGGNVSDVKGSMQEMRDTYNSGTVTGVTPGGGTSGTPSTPME